MVTQWANVRHAASQVHPCLSTPCIDIHLCTCAIKVSSVPQSSFQPSRSQGVEFVLIDTGDFWLFLICLEWLLVSCLHCLVLTRQAVVTNIPQFLLLWDFGLAIQLLGISSVAYFVSCVPETRVVLLCVPDTRVLCVSCLPFCVPERGTSETCGLDKRQATSNSYCERQASSHQTLNLHLFVLVSYTYTRVAGNNVRVRNMCVHWRVQIHTGVRAEWVVWCQTYIVEAGSNVTFDVMPLNMLRSHASPTTWPRLMSHSNLLLKWAKIPSVTDASAPRFHQCSPNYKYQQLLSFMAV